jgi:CheY-like chemotaxis protein
VDIAVDGEVALEMWREKDYDLCISDIRTPPMNGIELYRQLESECPEVVYKFIFTTGDMLSGNIKTFLEDTGRPYLPKPFAPENLRAIVKPILVTI